MKRRTTPTLKVEIDIKPELLSSVVFIFKQECSEGCTTSVKKTFPNGGVTRGDDGLYLIHFTEQETTIFAEEKNFYMDTRPITVNGDVVPTSIVILKMCRTLFSAGDVQ